MSVSASVTSVVSDPYLCRISILGMDRPKRPPVVGALILASAASSTFRL